MPFEANKKTLGAYVRGEKRGIFRYAILKYAPRATSPATTTARTTFLFSGRSQRKKYPKKSVDAMERNQRSVVVTSQSFEMRVNEMRADTAPMNDAPILGAR